MDNRMQTELRAAVDDMLTIGYTIVQREPFIRVSRGFHTIEMWYAEDGVNIRFVDEHNS